MKKFPTQKEFLAWRKLNPNVGTRSQGYSCPIAMFLKAKGWIFPYVFETYVTFGYGVVGINTPKWAQKFIRKFDRGEKV